MPPDYSPLFGSPAHARLIRRRACSYGRADEVAARAAINADCHKPRPPMASPDACAAISPYGASSCRHYRPRGFRDSR